MPEHSPSPPGAQTDALSRSWMADTGLVYARRGDPVGELFELTARGMSISNGNGEVEPSAAEETPKWRSTASA